MCGTNVPTPGRIQDERRVGATDGEEPIVRTKNVHVTVFFSAHVHVERLVFARRALPVLSITTQNPKDVRRVLPVNLLQCHEALMVNL